MRKKSVFKKLLLVFLVLIILIVLIKDVLLRIAIQSSASNMLGTEVELDSFSWGILNQTIKISGFRIQNPEGFPQEDPLLNMPELKVKYDLPELLFKQKIHISLFILNIGQMTLVKNKEGQLNADALKVTQEITKEETEEKKPTKKIPMQIDELNLSLRKVIYIDYSKSENGKPDIKFHDLGIENQKFTDITSAEQLIGVVLMQGLKGAAIKGAALYGAQALLGVGFAPLAVAGILTNKDYAFDQIEMSFSKLYDRALEFLRKNGEVVSEDKTTGQIKGKYEGTDITITISSSRNKKAEIKVSARKFMLPQPNTAEKFIYFLKK